MCSLTNSAMNQSNHNILRTILPGGCWLSAVVAACMLPGCNDDIFVDEGVLPDRTVVRIDGTGGEWSTDVAVKSFNRFDVPSPFDERPYVTWTDGNRRFVFENPAASFSVELIGKRLSVASAYNATGDTIRRTIRLEYSYTTKEIILEIAPGEPIRLVGVDYDGSPSIYEGVRSETSRTTFVNNSPLTQKFNVAPYAGSEARYSIIPMDAWFDEYEIPVELNVPAYDGTEWTVRAVKDSPVNEMITFKPPYFNLTIPVEVPPMTTVVVDCTVNYDTASDHGAMAFYNPTTGKTTKVEFFTQSTYPTSYELTTSYE